MIKVGIITVDAALLQQTKKIADEFKIPFFEDFFSPLLPEYLLQVETEKLVLIKPKTKSFKPFYVDFCAGKMAFRRAALSTKKDLLVKAIAIKKQKNPRVLDLMAGLGRDGFLMASLGCKITMVERNPVVYLLLQDGLQRFGAAYPDINSTLDYQLIFADAKQFLQTTNSMPDIIYLDPMFPARTKSALVKKEMQILQHIIDFANETDNEELFSHSLMRAKLRVVVKRPLHAPTLTALKPDGCIKGKAVRYDLYSSCKK